MESIESKISHVRLLRIYIKQKWPPIILISDWISDPSTTWFTHETWKILNYVNHSNDKIKYNEEFTKCYLSIDFALITALDWFWKTISLVSTYDIIFGHLTWTSTIFTLKAIICDHSYLTWCSMAINFPNVDIDNITCIIDVATRIDTRFWQLFRCICMQHTQSNFPGNYFASSIDTDIGAG